MALRPSHSLSLAGAALISWACSSGLKLPSLDDSREAPGASKLKVENGGSPVGGAFEHVPVPPASGPKLAPTVLSVPVREAPLRGSPVIGNLRLGARVARSREPVSRVDCPDGWYAVRPRGFVCAGSDATTDLEHPVARALQVEPDRARPMPYPYAFVRAIAPNYLRVPTKDEQFRYEMRLERHLRSYRKLAKEWDELEVGANDVPLDKTGAGAGRVPAHALSVEPGRRFGGDGNEEVPWWLKGERRIPNVTTFKAPPYAVIADRIKRHAGVALIGSFAAGPEAQGRRFAITTDARLLPADKLKADSGSPFHGKDIRATGLPVAFAFAEGAAFHSANGGKLAKGEPLERRQVIPLTGKVRIEGGDRFVEAKDGLWVRTKDVRTASLPGSLPWFAKGNTRWIDVSILAQTLVLWEGATPVYATLVSTGKDGLGDPRKTQSTPTGVFKIYEKHVTTTMDSDVADHEFELRDVPWVMYFQGGYALHAAYWHDDFGRSRSHGCVNLSPIDARYVFNWSAPDVPSHWHGTKAGQAFGNGTIVNVHP